MNKVLHSKQREECEARETRGAPLPRDSHEPGKEHLSSWWGGKQLVLMCSLRFCYYPDYYLLV